MKEKITESQAEQMYDDMLDELQSIKIGTMSYPGSYVLKELDPIAYRCGFTEYLDYLAEDYDISDFY